MSDALRTLRLLRCSALLAAACELLSAHQDEPEVGAVLDAVRDQRLALSGVIGGFERETRA